MKAYIFDLDGTIFESMDVWNQVDTAFFEKRNLSHPQDYTDAILAMHFEEAAAYTISRFNLDETVEDVVKEWLSLAAEAYNHVQLKPYAKEYITSLAAKGHKLAVATSLSTELLEPTLRKHGLYDMFHVICTAKDVGCGKAKPDIFLLTAKKLGVEPEECLLFDDILAAIKSAKSIGMKVCAVYEKTSQGDWDAMKALADYAIVDFSEML